MLLQDRAVDRDAFVFTSPTGSPLRHHNFSERHFKSAVRRAGLPEGLRLHDLRHTCAALLINSDPPAHPLAVMKRLGHSSITVTYDTYGHLFPASTRPSRPRWTARTGRLDRRPLGHRRR